MVTQNEKKGSTRNGIRMISHHISLQNDRCMKNQEEIISRPCPLQTDVSNSDEEESIVFGVTLLEEKAPSGEGGLHKEYSRTYLDPGAPPLLAEEDAWLVCGEDPDEL